MNDLENFKELLRGMAEAKSTAELWIKQARFMQWCGDNPDKLAVLIIASPVSAIDCEGAAEEIIHNYLFNASPPENRAALKQAISAIIHRHTAAPK